MNNEFPNVVTNQSAEQLSRLNKTADVTNNMLDRMKSITENVQGTWESFNSIIEDYNIALNTSKELTSNQLTQLSLGIPVIMGVKAAFTQLSNIDSSGINTFTSQVSDLLSNLTQPGTAANVVTESVKQLADVLMQAGRPMSEIQGMASQGAEKFAIYAKNVLTGADNTLRLQNAYIQLAARTGNLNNITELAGQKFENINTLLEKQQVMMSRAQSATGATKEEVEKYWAELGRVPGALAAVVAGTKDSSENTEFLTATIKAARGTGRDYSEVIDDLNVAFRTYNLIGEDALKFSTRISDVTQNLGVQLNTTKDAITSAANAFAMYVNTGTGAMRMTEGTATILNSYAQALQNTGLSGTMAVDVVKNMTSQISQLTLAQKSFLSAQTGGSGGLRGAFQIDQMMREGRVDEIFEKIRTQMKQQFGSIVTVDEAAQSEGAAAQLTKQMAILRQGPLGQMARSDVEAQRILEAFKAKDEGLVPEKQLTDDILSSSIDKGTALQEKSYTTFTKINSDVEAIRRYTDVGLLRFMQSGFTAGRGDTGLQTSDAQFANQSTLKDYMGKAARLDDAERAQSYAKTRETGEMESTIGRSMITTLISFKDTVVGLGDSLDAPIDALKQAVNTGDTSTAIATLDVIKATAEQNRQSMQHLAIDQRTQQQQYLGQLEQIIQVGSDWVNEATKKSLTQQTTATASASNNQTTAQTVGQPNVTSKPVQMDVHVTGICLKCNAHTDTSAQSLALTPAAG
jgi:hypothetical protein